eukprot:scaffold2998_cov158-Ochromonas_danica.AAC.4
MALHGFYLYLIAMGVSAVAYLMMTCSLSEMVSIVPFSGGCYGYVRCTLGPTVGYITGVMEASKYVMYSAAVGYLVSETFSLSFDFDKDVWLPVIWLGFYILSFIVPMLGTKVIWWCWGVLAIATLFVQLIFIFGSIKHGKIRNLGPRFNTFDDSSLSFFEIFPYAALLFTGIDDVRTCASDHSNKVVPWAMVVVIVSSSLVALTTVVCARMYEVNYIKFGLYTFPYDLGLQITLGESVNARYLSFFSLPALLGGFLAMTFAGGRQVCSMACSGLLPKALAIVQKEDDVLPLHGHKESVISASEREFVVKETKPILAIAATCFVSYFILLGTYYTADDFFLRILTMAGVQSCIETFLAMGAYLIFATRFSGMDRGFTSPFGMGGAVLVMGFTTMILFSLFYYGDIQKKNGQGIGEAAFFGVCMVYYYFVANKRQFFSKEEQDKFMKAYIVNANKKRRGSTTSKSRKSGFPSSILSSIMKHAFYRNSVLPITSTNSAENGHAHAVAVQAAQNFDMGLKGSKLADNSNVSPSAPPLYEQLRVVVVMQSIV